MRASFKQTKQSRQSRAGAVLVEFALIALVLYLLLGAILEFGRALHGSGTIQQAADVMARELSRTPMPPAINFDDALNREDVRKRIFDERLLVIDIDKNPNLDALFATFPIVNQQLRAVMIFDQVGDRRLIRYPGALVGPGNAEPTAPLPAGFVDSGSRVQVPVVQSRGNNGVETITWVRVVEETSPGAFSLMPQNPPNPLSGMVTLRINYPFQAATLSGYQPNPAGPYEPNVDRPISADDGAVSAPAPLGGATVQGGSNVGPYAGQYGLGKQEALGMQVRPFRKVLVGQAAYRREIFGN